MNKNRELVKNTAIITAGKICTQFISFFLLPFYTSRLTSEQYGTVDLVNTYVQLLLPIFLFQIDQAIFRFLIDSREDEKDITALVSTATSFILVQTAVFSGLFFAVSFLVSIRYKWYLLLDVIAAAVSGVLLQIARGLGDNMTYAVASFLAGLISIVCNILFILAFGMGADAILLSTFIAGLAAAAYVFFRMHLVKYISLSAVSREKLKKLLVYSLPLVPNALSWWLVNASDRTIVTVFLGTAANGILAASHKFSTMFITVYGIFNMSWTESVSLHYADEDKSIFFSDVFSKVYRLFAACCIGIIACMPFVFPILIKYPDAYGQIPVYMIAGLFDVLVGLYSVIYIAEKKTAEIAKTSVFAGVINIAVDLALIRHIGLYAASVSSAVAYAVMAIYRHFDVRKYIDHKISYPVFISSLLMIACVTAVYYSGNRLLQLAGLLLAVIYAAVINSGVIRSSFSEISKFVRRKTEKNRAGDTGLFSGKNHEK